MRMAKISMVFFFFSLLLPVYSQPPGFGRIDTVKVSESGSVLKNPWAGGLNFCQFSAIDLNLDGVKDLFVFDRTGNKITTYLNRGTPNTVDYTHAPQYEDKFPAVHDWVQLTDYNCDGKEDIFSHAVGGMEVYRNVSTAADGVKFQKVSDLLLSDYNPPGGTRANIYANYADVPAIADVDNDGDLDILNITFYSITPELHKNMSMETYGVCDSLNVYERATGCWGNYSELTNANDVTLGTACKGSYKTGENTKTEHTLGSCFLCLDIDGDGDKDIAQGIETFKNYVMLTNGGTASNANMTSKDINFPSYDQPVNFSYFPCGHHLDVNNDGLKDLLVSSGSANISENFNSILYYKNTGSVSSFSLSFQRNNFLQNEMIEVGEGAYPVFFDYNADGLLDLVIGNYGYYDVSGTPVSKVALYKNTGTSVHPQFELITRDFAGLSSGNLLNICPAFGDLDGDGDMDMMVGDYSGRLHYYENTAGAGNTVNYTLAQANYRNASGVVMDVGSFSVPQIVDVNKDGLKDIIIGSQNGKIAYYLNKGSAVSPGFDKVTSKFAGVNVTKAGSITGYSHPWLYESEGSYKLIVGSASGYLYYYSDIQDSLSTLVDSVYMNIKEGIRTAPNTADINNDGLNDLVVGNYGGGLGFYGGKIADAVNEKNWSEELAFDVFPNPATDQFTIRFSACLAVAGYSKVLRIYDITGREVLKQAIAGCKGQTDVFNLQPGMYFCEIFYPGTGRNYHLTRKILIQK